MRVTLLEKTACSERVCVLTHADTGPHLLCIWYRLLVPGETDTIRSLREKWDVHHQAALGTMIVGDMNVHHARWLRFSSRNSVEGEMFTGEQLQRLLVDGSEQPLSAVLGGLTRSLRRWRGAQLFDDDISMLALEFQPEAQ